MGSAGFVQRVILARITPVRWTRESVILCNKFNNWKSYLDTWAPNQGTLNASGVCFCLLWPKLYPCNVQLFQTPPSDPIFTNNHSVQSMISIPLRFNPMEWGKDVSIDKFCLLKFFYLFYVPNLGHCHAKQTFFRSVGLKMDEKQAVTCALFFLHFWIPKGTP